MQFIVEFLTAVVVWAATLAFAQMGVDIDMTRKDEARAERVVQRTRAPAALPIARDCPERARAIVQARVRAA